MVRLSRVRRRALRVYTQLRQLLAHIAELSKGIRRRSTPKYFFARYIVKSNPAFQLNPNLLGSV